MAIVIDPKAKIEEYLASQGYSKNNPANCHDQLHESIINGAAQLYSDLLGVNLARQGYCWAQTVTKIELMDIICEAVDHIEEQWDCYNDSDASTRTLIARKAKYYE